MSNRLFSKLAIENIRKNKNTYFPYILSSVVMIAIFYILHSVAQQVDQSDFLGNNPMKIILDFAIYTSGIFSMIFIFYTNSFLLKRRKKELGLYSVLGMEKKHIGKVLIYEIFYLGAVSLIGGILTGLVFSRLMYALLIKLIKLNTPLSFGISIKSLLVTTSVFIVTFFIVMMFNLIKVRRANPIDLIKGGNKGEKEPKGSLVIGLVGLIFLGVGYYLALSIANPMQALQTFFIAVVCVSIATYLLFTSGSISLIKMLRKNKSFYYNKNNFISISNMIYRMKQNAVGLANIAILSTSVLIILSTTISLYVGMEDIMNTSFPHDVTTNYIYENQNIENIEDTILDYAKENKVEISDIDKFFLLETEGYLNKDKILPIPKGTVSSDMYYMKIKTLDDFNRSRGTNLSLNEDEIFLSTNVDEYDSQTLNLFGKELKVKPNVESLELDSIETLNTITILVKNLDELKELETYVNQKQDYKRAVRYQYDFNLHGEKEDKIEFSSTLIGLLDKDIEQGSSVKSVYTSAEDYNALFGSLFFIGLFLGSLFMIATVLIIYYKQISEGYDDKERFEILQKVGMSKKEVRKTIQSQIMIVFFLPLVTAIIHMAVAFPLVTKIMAMFNLTNIKLFLISTGTIIIVFSIVYAVVYRWTARIYYKIVN